MPPPINSLTRSAFSWAAARATGASHEVSGESCQDALTLLAGQCRGVPYAVGVVADGAGSARFAEEASKLATRLFTAFVASEISVYGLDEAGLVDLALDAANGVHRKLRRLAREREVHADHLATTLLGFIATSQRTVIAQVGDGGIVHRADDMTAWQLALEPQHGEYRNESRFISDADALDWLDIVSIDGPPGTIVAFTDGLEDLVLGTFYEVHPPLFDLIADRLAQKTGAGLDRELSTELTELLVSGAVRSRTDDDTTLLAIRFHGDDR